MKKFELPVKIGNHSEFVWGPVIRVYTIAQYDIVQFNPMIVNQDGEGTGKYDINKSKFHIYVNGKDACQTFDSLDIALIGAINYFHNGANHLAVTQGISKMLNLDH